MTSESRSGDFVTIVSGLPRSGTSMMMQMLERGGMPVLVDDVRAADDDNPHGYYEFAPVKATQRDASWVAQAQGRAVKVIYLLLDHLTADYNYRVILMQRNIRHVVRSQNAMLARQGQSGAEVNEAEMVEIFQRQLTALEERIARQSNFRVLNVTYQDVLSYPAEQAVRICQFLDAELDVAQMMAAVDPALRRQGKGS